MTSLYRVNYQLRAHKRDPFIEFIKSLLLTPFILHAGPEAPNPEAMNLEGYSDVLLKVEEMIEEHRSMSKDGQEGTSRLSRLVPSIGKFFTHLPLREAFLRGNKRHAIAARRFVPPSFNDIRRFLNTAQCLAVAPTLQLVTFDGDMTLYADGQDFTRDSVLVGLLISLLRHGLHIAIVTAASYGSDPVGYEGRLSGLLEEFRAQSLTPEQLGRFFVLGGECNYLFRTGPDAHLVYIPEVDYHPPEVLAWTDEQISSLLDAATMNVERCVREMRLPLRIIRKGRAVGLVPHKGAKVEREQLDECVLSTQQCLASLQQRNSQIDPSCVHIPFCAFNGGNDVWVDVGNKLIGVQFLQRYLHCTPATTLHIGDQFLSTGNDFATRSACCTMWIVSPQETADALIELTELLKGEEEMETTQDAGKAC